MMRSTFRETWLTRGRRWPAGALPLACLAAIASMLAWASAPSQATTTTVSVTQGSFNLSASPSPQAGSPVTITASGQVGVTSTLLVFAQLGRPCAATEGQEAAAAAQQVVQQVIQAGSAPFSVTGQFTPATAGTYYICGYLSGSSGGTQESQSTAIAVAVAPAPPPPPSPAPAATGVPGGGQTSAQPCVVPPLARHSLAGAKRLLAASHCSLGRILQPSARGLRRARSRPGGKALVLVVGSQFPAAGTRLRANQFVAIRLVLGRAPGAAKKTVRK